jgi:N-methylhydantoinase B
MSPTSSAVYAAVRHLIPGNPPNNEGFFRPIEIRAPVGCIVNAVAPASVAARGLTAFRTGNVVFGALAQIAPDRVFACEVGPDCGISFAGLDGDGRPIVFLEFLCGSWGGRPHADGIDGCSSAFVNFANNSVELVEAEYPVVIERYGYVPDSGGAGRHRGGLALERHYRFAVDGAQLHLRSDRTRFRPYGAHGGEAGAHAGTTLLRDGKTIALPGKCKLAVQRGDVLRHRLAGAGGWGPPAERDPQAIQADILDGKVTAEEARRQYGDVAVSIGTSGDLPPQGPGESNRGHPAAFPANEDHP